MTTAKVGLPFMKQSGRHLGLCVVALFAMGAPGFSQSSTAPAPDGLETVRGYQLSPDARVLLDPSGRVFMRLPAVQRKAAPELMGMFQQGTDIELFLKWMDDAESKTGLTQYRLEVLHGRRGAEAALVHDFTLQGAYSWVRFFQQPDARDNPAVLIEVNVGTLAIDTYLLAPDRKSMQKLFSTYGNRSEFMDLDRDGVYELIAWEGTRNPRCSFGRMNGDGGVPEIFVRAGAGYRQVWPPSDWAQEVMDSRFADLRGDGATELIAIQDSLSEGRAQELAVYRFENGSLRLVAQASLPPQRIAFQLLDPRDSPGGKEILFRAAAPGECQIGPLEDQTGIVKAYLLNGDKLQEVQP